MVQVIMNSRCTIDHDGPGDPVPREFCQTCHPEKRRKIKKTPPPKPNGGLTLSPPVAIQKAIQADYTEGEEMQKIGPKEAALRQQREAIVSTKPKRTTKTATVKTTLGPQKLIEPPQAQAAAEQETAVHSAKKKTTAKTKTAAKTSARKAVKSTAARPTKDGARKSYDWSGAAENAAKGVLPPAPDFSANTHRFYREPLADCVKLVKAGDVKALLALKFTRTDGSPGMIKRYRDIAVTALKAKK